MQFDFRLRLSISYLLISSTILNADLRPLLSPPLLCKDWVLVLQVGFVEDRIQGLQLVAVCFGEEEVDARNEGDFEAEEDEAGLPGDAVNHDGCELDEGVVEEPVKSQRMARILENLIIAVSPVQTSAQTIRLSSDPHRAYFNRTQPCHTEPAQSEERLVYEDEHCGCICTAHAAGRQ